jgi:hypothetical protein
MRHLTVFVALIAILQASSAFAGSEVPMPGAGVAGPVAMIAAIGAVLGVKYLRGKR